MYNIKNSHHIMNTEQIKLTCFNIIYNSEFEESYQIMSAGEVTNSNVKTPNGTKVPHIEGLTFNGHGYYGTTEDLDKEMKKNILMQLKSAMQIHLITAIATHGIVLQQIIFVG